MGGRNGQRERPLERAEESESARQRTRERVIRGTSDAKGNEETRDREDRSLIRTFHTQTQTDRRADGSRAKEETAKNQGSERQVLRKRTENEQRTSERGKRVRVREREMPCDS